MIESKNWLEQITAHLQDVFGPRLLFVGLQGSYRRGEATEDSDFDLVVILDHLDDDDLRQYRSLTAALPEPDKACGFIAGRAELLNWPRHEIFQFAQDTQAYWGQLDALVPDVGPGDAREGLKVGAANLYHGLGHVFLHGGGNLIPALGAAYKTAFFLLQLKHYLATGRYVLKKTDLAGQLSGPDAEILKINRAWPDLKADLEQNPDQYFQLLFNWAGAILRHS